mmetsp:Transcript_42268/g.111998  ORF Transcript_42268/g.111998 Transcript_42268/m.111998 type:complete len:224 (+) Transcript_42268:147-818(+)
MPMPCLGIGMIRSRSATSRDLMRVCRSAPTPINSMHEDPSLASLAGRSLARVVLRFYAEHPLRLRQRPAHPRVLGHGVDQHLFPGRCRHAQCCAKVAQEVAVREPHALEPGLVDRRLGRRRVLAALDLVLELWRRARRVERRREVLARLAPADAQHHKAGARRDGGKCVGELLARQLGRRVRHRVARLLLVLQVAQKRATPRRRRGLDVFHLREVLVAAHHVI